jgi:hypothetical protein
MIPQELTEHTVEESDDNNQQSVAPEATDSGVTARVCALCLIQGVIFGYCVPFLDLKMGHSLAGSRFDFAIV